MAKTLLLVASAAAALFPVASATAQTRPAERGYQVSMGQHGRVCLRPTAFHEAIRLGISRNHTECQTPSRWADQGLTVHQPTDRTA